MPTRERAVRATVAALVLPHELGHALLAWLWRLDSEVTILPAWEGATNPLARFNASLDAETSTLAIRVVAVGPLLLALLVAGLLGTVLPRDSPLVVPALLALSFWGSLSSGDLAIATQPAVAREYGEFLAPRPPQVERAALLLTVLTVALVGVLLLR